MIAEEMDARNQQQDRNPERPHAEQAHQGARQVGPAAAALLPRLDIADLRQTLDLPDPEERTISEDTLLHYVLTT